MCLAIPMRVVERDGDEGVVELDGVRHAVDLSLVPVAETGDFVIVHAGFAIERLDRREAEERIALFAELAETWDAGTGPGTPG